MADKLTIVVTLSEDCPASEKDARTARLLDPAVTLAGYLAPYASGKRPVDAIEIRAHDGVATVTFARGPRAEDSAVVGLKTEGWP